MSAASVPNRRMKNPAVFVCDLQDKFRNAIWQFDKILLTTLKVLRAAEILHIPVYVTTQNAAKLGGVVAELKPLLREAVTNVDKTLFSMMVPQVAADFPDLPVVTVTDEDNDDDGNGDGDADAAREVVIVGIESHICVTQTALDLLARGHRVYVLADGVSSCSEHEVPVALARLRAEGAVVTTSESWLYECMGDAGIAEFRDVARLVKETGPDTRITLAALLGNLVSRM
ncbi:Isochorismatase hydrolase [Xylariaceae sp. FL0804]|nr:Isochorismatase hydrolase [Xylariaceae sp. FL0804]